MVKFVKSGSLGARRETLRTASRESGMRTFHFGLAVFLSLAVGSLADQVPLPPLPNVTIVPPAMADLAATYPAAARGRNIQGFVLLRCTIRSDNAVGCTAGQWSPSGYGFEAAALQIGAKLHVKSNDRNSYAGGRFSLPVRFPADPQAGAALPPAPTLDAIQVQYPLPAAMMQARPNVTIIPPSPDEVADAFPETARGTGIAGRVMLSCTIRDDATLGCTVDNEAPPGYGFGDAALTLSTKLRVKSNDQNSYAGTHMNIPIRFPADPAP
jgi:hypothetical protein